MVVLRRWAVAFGIAPMLVFGADAQDRTANVVVTATRLNPEDLQKTPNVFLRVPADFVQFGLTCQSSTRDVADRRRELEGTFESLLDWDLRTDGFELNGGEAGYEIVPMETVSFDEIYSEFGYQAGGGFDLTLAVDIRNDENFEGVKGRVESALDGMAFRGRVECFSADEQFLGLRGLDEHRADLLQSISDEVEQLQAAMGADKVTVTGLESRVISQPSGALSMDVFIPYLISLEVGR